MKKLELKHLVGYLPYKALCYAPAYQYGLSKPLEKEMDVYLMMNLISCDTQFKLRLRSLSYLTKEIEINGEKFVPLVELYKIACGSYKDRIVKYYSIMASNEIQIELEGFRNYYFGLFKDDIDLRLEVGYSFIMYSTNLIAEDKKIESVKCHNLLFEKLLEWHFDIYGLIDFGLAIDLNDLEK